MVGRFCGFAMNFIFINSCTLGLRKWSIDSLDSLWILFFFAQIGFMKVVDRFYRFDTDFSQSIDSLDSLGIFVVLRTTWIYDSGR